MLPGPRHTGGSLPCRRYLLAPLTGDKEGRKSLMVLRVKPTPTRLPTNSLYTPMDNTHLHSISSVCHPWGPLLLFRHSGKSSITQEECLATSPDRPTPICILYQACDIREAKLLFPIENRCFLSALRKPENETTAYSTSLLACSCLLFRIH